MGCRLLVLGVCVPTWTESDPDGGKWEGKEAGKGSDLQAGCVSFLSLINQKTFRPCQVQVTCRRAFLLLMKSMDATIPTFWVLIHIHTH